MANVAETILAQLGGNKFLVMTGSKNLLNGGNYLQFDLGRGAINKATKCRIELRDDVYQMTFYKWNRKALTADVVREHAHIYADDLRAVFERATGFYTSL